MTRFKVGDRVRFVRAVSQYYRQFIGRSFTVSSVFPGHGDSDALYAVECSELRLWDSEITLADPLSLEEIVKL